MNFLRKSIAPLFLMLAIAAAFSSCKKYDEGPGFSLRSPESRLEGTWKVEKATEKDGTNSTADYSGVNFRYSKDGSFSYFGTQQGISFNVEGTWWFNDDKTELTTKVSYEIGGVNYTFEETFLILRLTNKEFWSLTEEEEEIHMVTAE